VKQCFGGVPDVGDLTDKGYAWRAEQRLELSRIKNESLSKEFIKEIVNENIDQEDTKRPATNKSRFKVIVSGHIVETYEFDEGVHYGKRDKPDREERERIKTEDGLTIDPETGEILYDPLAARRANMRASKNEFRRIILANFDSGSKFITLTFRNGSVNDVQDVTECNKAFDKFIKRMRREYGGFKYARVIEFQDANGRGAVHYHLIFDDLPYIPYETLGAIWGNGFIGINRIDHVDNVGAYIRKYMAQDMEDRRLMGKKAYATSQGLTRPYEAYGHEAAELIAAYELEQKKTVFTNSYESEHQGKTTYKEFNLKRDEKG
jgi:hypothetical protein